MGPRGEARSTTGKTYQALLAWSLDGSFRGMPAAWDFPRIDGADFGLPEAAVATWGGFVFVHPGTDPEPFELFSHPAEHWLEIGQSWAHAPGFELLGLVIDQDIESLPKVQKGLKNASHKSIVLADYQEIRIRHFHQRLDVQLGLA